MRKQILFTFVVLMPDDEAVQERKQDLRTVLIAAGEAPRLVLTKVRKPEPDRRPASELDRLLPATADRGALATGVVNEVHNGFRRHAIRIVGILVWCQLGPERE